MKPNNLEDELNFLFSTSHDIEYFNVQKTNNGIAFILEDAFKQTWIFTGSLVRSEKVIVPNTVDELLERGEL